MPTFDYNGSGAGDLGAFDVSGNPQASALGVGIALTPGTYFAPIGNQFASTPSEASLVSAHLKWTSTFAAVITVESCNFPATLNAVGPNANPDDVADWENAGTGNWIQENPSTAYVGVVGSGNTVSNLTITAGGTNAGGCMIDVGNYGARRMRLKLVVTVGGTIRINRRGKNAA